MKTDRDLGPVFWSISISVVYATVRYNLCKGVAWADWPVYIVNKAAALSALILLCLFAFRKVRGHEQGLMSLMAAAFSLALLHVALTLGILNPAYFGGLFEHGRLTAIGGLALLAGALCIVGFYRRWLNLPKLCVLIAIHVLLLGYANWPAYADWPGFLPPISLVAFSLAVTIAAMGLRPADRKRPPAESGFRIARPDFARTPRAAIGPAMNGIRIPEKEW